MKNPVLKIENLTIGFKKNIFESINAQLCPGEITTLMGVNGVGKSCLLKTLGHLISAKSGVIKLNGLAYSDYTASEFARITSLVLTEKFQVDFLRVDELVAMGRSPYTNWSGKMSLTDHNIVRDVMIQTGIELLAGRFFSELSDGQKQKVLIARALAQKPQLLILDEPTTYLDIPSKVELLKLLRKIANENQVAILLSSHDLDLMKSTVDQIWLMGTDGKFHTGSPENMTSSGLFTHYFQI